MKKTIFCLAAGVMALTACTSTDVIEEGIQSNAIGFQNVVSKESRAVTTNTFSAFHVYGYYTKKDLNTNQTTVVGVFNDDLVTKSGTGSDAVWGYENVRYWVPDANYFFYAYSCDDKEAPTGTASFDLTGSTTADRTLNLNEYTLHDHDLVYASNEGETGTGIVGQKTNNAKVALNFSHILTRVRVNFISKFAAGYQIKVSDVKLSNVINKGDFSPKPSMAWTVSETNIGEVKLDMYSDAEGVHDVATLKTPAVGTEGQEGYVAATGANAYTVRNYVMPYMYKDKEATSVNLTFNIYVSDENGVLVYQQSVKGSWKPNWELGKSYVYNVEISGVEAGLEPIEFAVGQTIAGWGGDSEIDPTDENIKMEITSSAITGNN